MKRQRAGIRYRLMLLCFLIQPFKGFSADPAPLAFVEDQTYPCSRYDVIDIEFTADAGESDPFSVQFGALFTGPDDIELDIPGFYNGGESFLLRFSPPEPGSWTFETHSSLAALAGKKGRVRGGKKSGPGRHGPLTVMEGNPRHFRYSGGAPCFVLAYEADWLFALDAGNDRGIPKTGTLVGQIAAHGFNQIVMNVYAYDVSWDKDPDLKAEHEFGPPGIYPFLGTNQSPDFSALNVDFFKHFDRVIRLLDTKGITAHIMIYVWNKRVSWPDMHSGADNLYFDYVVSRYQAFSNVIWDISKEALAYGRCDMEYINERILRLRRLDAYGRLLTVHDYAYCSAYPEHVDFISVQSWRSGLYHHMRSIAQRHPDRPVYNIEHGGYEKGPYDVFRGDYSDPEICLTRNYQCVFAGAYSTYYWQCSSWNVVIHDPLSLPEGERPRFDYYRHLSNLFSRFDFSALQPSVSYSSSGYALSNDRDLFLFLIQGENDYIHVHLPNDIDKQMSVTWFNPFSGEYRAVGSVTLRDWHEFSSPWGNGMAVLILEGK